MLEGKDFRKVADFFAIDDPNFRGGARAAIGDVNGDGVGDVAVAAGFLGGPRVSTWDGKSLVQGTPTRLFNDFFIFGGSDVENLRNGVNIAVGDVNGDGYADLIAGGGPGGGPRVLAVDGASLAHNGSANPVTLFDFFVQGRDLSRGGVRVAAKDFDGDGYADLVTGDGASSMVTAFKGSGLSKGSHDALFFSRVVDLPEDADGVYVG